MQRRAGQVTRWRVGQGLACCALLLAWPQVGDADNLPVPRDVGALQQPYELVLGSLPIKAQGFSTSMAPDDVREFYTQALAKQGWKVASTSPWMSQTHARLQAAREALRDQPELAAQSGINEAQLDSVHALMVRQLYAVRDEEHLVLNIQPQGLGSMVFVNRWEGADAQNLFGPGTSSQTAPSLRVQGAPTSGAAASENESCCVGQQRMPDSRRRLPNSIPAYPNAQPIATGASAGDRLSPKGSVSEVYFTEDAVSQVISFYRQHMAYGGWSETGGRGALPPQFQQMLTAQGVQMDAQMVEFRNKDEVCGIVVTQRLPMVADLPLAPADQEDHTVIMLTYFKHPELDRVRNYDPRNPQGRR